MQGLHLIFIWRYEINALSLQKNYKIMRYSIAFKDLPFKPEKRQIIYVENQYDERINTIIKEKYDWLKYQFKLANLDFVYLPMFFNDEETKEKVLYYAPYLTSDIIEKAELRSSYLLGYMSHIENKDKISPSLLFAPKKEDGEWIFQGQTIDFDNNSNNIIKWFEEAVADIEEDLSYDMTSDNRRYDEDIEEFKPAIAEECPAESGQVEYSSTPDIQNRIKQYAKSFSRKVVEEERATGIAPSTLDDILDEDVRETLEELERKIERLRLLGIPLDVIVDFVARYETISRLLITDDLRIFLPDYNNIEVKMPALYKAVYLLFIYHKKEGIVLQQMENYHSELEKLYCKTKKVERLTPRQLESINKLESSWNDDGSIYVVLSRIKKLFVNAIDEHLAKHYYIEGKPGHAYNIALNPDLIIWEDEYE